MNLADPIRLNLLLGALLLGSLLPVTWAADANDEITSIAPSWAKELKGGKFTPDLSDYATYYGSDDNTYWAVAGAYRFKQWLELGLELGYSKDNGTGLLPNTGNQGGNVEYTLMPLQLFVNLRYDVTPNQLLVPYAGVGITTAFYRQKISQQSDRTGYSDVGGAARAGLQLSLNRLSPGSVAYVRDNQPLKAYIFLEGQYFSTEKDNIDVGGDVYLLGLRFEF